MLQKINFLPGFNKQITATTAEGQWIGGDYVRFRYETPEKIGGWSELGESSLTGVTRAQHHFLDNTGIKYAALGTNRILYVYSGGIFYDIHPIKTTSTLTSAFTTTNGSAAVKITFGGSHNISAGDILYLDSFTTITNSDYVAADFDDIKFMVTSIDSSTQLTITMPSAETGSGATLSGGIRVQHYYPVGPAQQLGAYGWGIGQWSGEVAGEATTTLNGALTADVSDTTVVLADASAFPTSGTSYILVGTELISYTGVSTNTLTGVARAAQGTAVAVHADGATVSNASDYVGWGEASSGDKVFEPGLWSLDNYGTKLIALIYNSACFESI